MDGSILQRPELSLDLGFGSAVPNLRMQKDSADGAADEGELFIGITAAIVHIQPGWDPMGGPASPRTFWKL